MPVDTYRVDSLLADLESTNSMLVQPVDVQKWAKELGEHLHQVCLPLDAGRVTLRGTTGAQDGGNRAIRERRMFAEAAIASKSLRVDRLALIEKLKQIQIRAESLRSARPGTDEALDIHRSLKDVADDVARIVGADIDPQRVCPFEKSPEYAKCVAQAATAAWENGIRNPREAKVVVNETIAHLRSELVQKYVENTYPEKMSKEVTPVLSQTELRTLGRTYYQAFDELSLNLDEQQVADSIAKAIAGGIRCHRWACEDSNVTTKEFWFTQIQNNFMEPSQYRDLRKLQACDVAPPIEVLKAVRANCGSDSFPLAQVQIEYLDASGTNNDDSRTLDNILSHPVDDGKILVLSHGVGGGMPTLVKTLSPETPDVLQVIKPGHNSRNLVFAKSANADDKLEAILDCSTELQPILSSTDAAKEVDALWEEWRNIPLENREQAIDERERVAEKARQLASKIPPPGFGGASNRYSIAGIVTLLMATESSADTVKPMWFRPPQGLSTLELDIEPQVRAYKFPGDESSSTHITVKIRGGDDIHYKNVPNSDVSDVILTHHREEGGILGVSSNIPGMVCYVSGDSGTPKMLGHWLSPEDSKAMLQASPLELTNRQSNNEKAVFGELPEATERRVDEWIAAAVALTLPPETSDLDLELAIDASMYTAEIPLQIAHGDLMTCPKASMSRFVVQELIDQPEDLRIALMQLSATAAGMSDIDREDRISRVREGDWEVAKGWVDALYSADLGQDVVAGTSGPSF